MKRVALILLLIWLVALEVSAQTLLKYENRVARAAEQIARIKSDAEYAESGIEDTRQLLPRHEQIEHEGKRLAIDNTWLHVALDAYEAERDPQKKKARLSEIGDRLSALDAALIRAAETSEDKNSGQQARARIRDILNRNEYHEKEESRISLFIKKVYNKVRAFLGELLEAFQRLLGKIFGSAAEGSIV